MPKLGMIQEIKYVSRYSYMNIFGIHWCRAFFLQTFVSFFDTLIQCQQKWGRYGRVGVACFCSLYAEEPKESGCKVNSLSKLVSY